MGYNVVELVDHTFSDPHWMPDGRFWYRDSSSGKLTYLLVDPEKHTRKPAFDQAKLFTAIVAADPNAKQLPRDADHLGLSELGFENNDKTLLVTTHGRLLRCSLGQSTTCEDQKKPDPKEPGRAQRNPETSTALSPDKRKLAFIRDWNLWVRELATGKETQLTTDGIENFGYATDNSGWTHSDRAIVLWSPDSTKIATFQQDQRKTGEMYLVPVTYRHPKLEAWKYPLVGDKDVTMIERVVIDVTPTPRVIRFKMPPDQHRSTLCDDVSCHGGWEDVQWSPDAKHVAFVSTSRDHKQEWLRIADAQTGDIREVFHETAPKFFESGSSHVNWKYLPESNEFLWFSERSNWGQMYLYDLTTGKLKNQITHGDGNVTDVLHVDPKAREIYYLAVGKQPGVDPYYQQFYRTSFDGQHTDLLTPDPGTHAVTVSPDGRFFTDVTSTPTTPQIAVLRDDTGKEVLPLEKQDISRLVASGWKPLRQFTVKARDGKTDLYGYMFEPTHMDSAKKYPIVDYVYPGPQIGSCGGRNFSPAHGDNQALAELGFVVVCIDGMGTPNRSKAFHEFYYGDLADDTIPDQVAGIRELAAKFPFLDADRVGIWGHSGGGNATASAMFHFPDFFKVGIAESGNHDNREYEDDWAEKWAGLEVVQPDGTSNYDSQANENFAGNLKGHLMLAHGTMDDNVPPNNTLLVVEALIKANKDFDLIMIPNAHHGYGAAAPYMMRRRWDYFTRYLAGDVPPHEYNMKPWPEVLKIMEGPGAGSGGPED